MTAWLDEFRAVSQAADDGEWSNIAAVDVLRLAVIGRMVRYGVSPGVAASAVRELIDQYDQMALLSRNREIRGLARKLATVGLVVTSAGDGWGWRLYQPGYAEFTL